MDLNVDIKDEKILNILNSDYVKEFFQFFNNFKSKRYKIKDHKKHAYNVAEKTYTILKEIGSNQHECELGYIAGLFHDVCIIISLNKHSEIGGTLVASSLLNVGFSLDDAFYIGNAIGNHHDNPYSKLDAALIIADNTSFSRNLILDNVEFKDIKNPLDIASCSVIRNEVIINKRKKIITVELDIEKGFFTPTDFLVFFSDMITNCEKASNFLGYDFKLKLNGKDL